MKTFFPLLLLATVSMHCFLLACSSQGSKSDERAPNVEVKKAEHRERSDDGRRVRAAARRNPVHKGHGARIEKKAADAVHARHILVMHNESKRKPASISRTKEEALKLIKKLEEKVKAADADFAAIAKDNSDCPSKSKGGDLGTFGRGRMAPPFDKAVFQLKENEISSIVETDFGYHLIQRLPN